MRWLLLAAIALIGLGHVALLPPFEGFDETAHYSSLRQVADTGTIPRYGASGLDRAVVDWPGPVPYGSLEPPFDRDDRVYRRFFEAPDRVDRFRTAEREQGDRPGFRPTDAPNWQAQHPPLYYLVLAPLTRITDRLPLLSQLLALRLASAALAIAGLALGLQAWRGRPGALLGFGLYPLALPQLFPEFMRLGNDSLCLLLSGALAWLLVGARPPDIGRGRLAAAGVVLGLGLLTKAFFLPITAASALWLALAGGGRRLGWLLLPALALGGGWYLAMALAFGAPTGSDDVIRLAAQGGLWAGLAAHGSAYAVARGLAATIASWSWAGTWSLTRLPPLLHLPLLALAGWLLAAFLGRQRRRPLADPGWLFVLLAAAFGAGLGYHVLIGVATNGNGNTPGWYLHILAPWTAPALGLGAAAILERPRARPVLIALLAYAALFQVIALWSEAALYAGCATKGDDKLFRFDGALCLDRLPEIADRLALLAWPGLAAVGFGAGAVLAGWVAQAAWQGRRGRPRPVGRWRPVA